MTLDELCETLEEHRSEHGHCEVIGLHQNGVIYTVDRVGDVVTPMLGDQHEIHLVLSD